MTQEKPSSLGMRTLATVNSKEKEMEVREHAVGVFRRQRQEQSYSPGVRLDLLRELVSPALLSLPAGGRPLTRGLEGSSSSPLDVVSIQAGSSSPPPPPPTPQPWLLNRQPLSSLSLFNPS